MNDLELKKSKFEEILEVTIGDIIEAVEGFKRDDNKIETEINYHLDQGYNIEELKLMEKRLALLYVYFKSFSKFDSERFLEVIRLHQKVIGERE